MAVRTVRPVSLAGGLAYLEYEYDDASGQVLLVRGVNDSDRAFYASVRGTPGSGRQANGLEYSYTFEAHSGVTEWAIPQGQQKKFDLVPDGGDPGRPDYYPTLAGLEIEAGDA